jgi:hypothetical protein
MTWRTAALGLGAGLLFFYSAYTTGAAGVVRRTFGLPRRDQIVQWWIHWGSSVAAPVGKRPLVFLITGQSNAGNYGRGIRRRAERDIYNAYGRRLWLARDPLLGSDGLGVSPWIPFAENLLQRETGQSIVLAMAVRGGMGVREWNQGALMRTDLFARIADLRALGLTPDYVLWQQGESDALSFQTNPGDYADIVRSLVDSLRQVGVSAPVLIARATRNAQGGISAPIRNAQMSLVDPSRGILRGPDADHLGPEFRYDGTHFSEAGITALSRIWADAVSEAPRTLRRQ